MIHFERGDPPAGFDQKASELALRFTEALNQDSSLTASKFWLEGMLLLASCSAEKRVQSEARQLLIWCLQEDAPFCAMTRAFLRHKAPKLASPAQPHPRVSEQEGFDRIAQLVAEHREEIRRLV